MSSFKCEKCNTDIIDTPKGYVTGCSHYQKDRVASRYYKKIYASLHVSQLKEQTPQFISDWKLGRDLWLKGLNNE